jgi:hypothetical protein
MSGCPDCGYFVQEDKNEVFVTCPNCSSIFDEDEIYITDGCGNYWSSVCYDCMQLNEVVRLGKVQCGCYYEIIRQDKKLF